MIRDKSEQEKIIRTVHEQGHLGRDKVTDQFGSRYYWDSLCKDVFQLVIYYVQTNYLILLSLSNTFNSIDPILWCVPECKALILQTFSLSSPYPYRDWSTRFFLNKELLYKELQAENWQKIKELLRNCPAWDYKTINNISIIVSFINLSRIIQHRLYLSLIYNQLYHLQILL